MYTNWTNMPGIKHLFLFCSFLVVLLGCSDEERKNSSLEVVESNMFFQKSAKIESVLKGKHIPNLETELDLNNNSESGKFLILYFTTYDCSSCVNKAIEIMNEEEISKKNIPLVIEAGERLSFSSIHFDFAGNTLVDSLSIIHEQLGYFPTPALIRYSSKNGIERMYFVPTFEDTIAIGKFRKDIIIN